MTNVSRQCAWRACMGMGILILVACPKKQDDPPVPGADGGSVADARSSDDGGPADVSTDAGGGGVGTLQGRLRIFAPGTAGRGDRRPAPEIEQALRGLLKRAPALAAGPVVPRRSAGTESYVAGEVIVGLKDEASLGSLSKLSALAGLERFNFEPGVFASSRILSLRIRDRGGPKRLLDREETRRVRDRLREHRVFRSVDFNGLRRVLRTPNDPGYALQWHYPQINLPAAWDITTGTSSVVVAIVDDGMNVHPDVERVLAGYDMISDTKFSGDGDGRDADPSQVTQARMWNVNHVAGTVGAATDNGAGLAGVSWGARLLPVRVLGVEDPLEGAGTSIDIIAGFRWAAGLDVPGVPENSNPAQVINMSLGGGEVSTAEQESIDEVVNAGAIVVVAAGNSDMDAGATPYGAYDNVIVVGAVDYTAQRASYSNFGAAVDIMAPGGDLGVDANSDGLPDGVISTWFSLDGTVPLFLGIDGTSMASPHVAGVVALMKSANPMLTHRDAERILKDSATPSSRCPEGCGAGLVNAALAVIRAGAPLVTSAALGLSADRLNLGGRDRGQLSIQNRGGGVLEWSAVIEGSALRALSIDEARGQIEAGGAQGIAIRVDRSGLSDGWYQSALVVRADGREARAQVIFSVGPEGVVPDVGAVEVATVMFPSSGGAAMSIFGGSTMTHASSGYQYSLDTDSGSWFVLAVADRNGNGDLDSGDMWGVYRSFDGMEGVTIGPGLISSSIDFTLIPYDASAAPPCTDLRGCVEACATTVSPDDVKTCIERCPIDSVCDACGQSIRMCGAMASCGTDDACLCLNCASDYDRCFGPNFRIPCWMD